MRQYFIDKLQACENDKEKLSGLMAEIDTEKRSLKSQLSRISSESDGKFGRGRERQVQIRKMKDKKAFLTEEREMIRTKLGSMKTDKKALNRAANSRSIEFAHAFIAAAERMLPEEQFLALELRATDILSAN